MISTLIEPSVLFHHRSPFSEAIKMSNITTIAVQASILFSILLISYTILKIFYNLFLHPLRSYPGPLLARATILAFQRASIQGKIHLWQHDLHKKYGPVVRYSPDELSFIEPEVWKDVYGHKASHGGGSFAKDSKFYGPDIFGTPPGLIRADTVSHARQRKLVSHAFSDKALREQESLLKSYVELLVKKLKETVEGEGKGAANLVDWYNFTTFDIMADLTFGEPLKLLEGSTYSPWVRALFDNLKLVLFSQHIRAWPGIEALLNMLVPETVREKRRLHIRHSVDRVEKRLARKTDRPDIWTYVMRFSDSEENKGKGLTETEMHSNAGLFMLAGTETTATELSGLTYRLLKSPERLNRLKREIRDAFETYEDMTMVKLSQLEYLGACIEEGLRVYPPVPFGLARVVPKGGGLVGGRWMPEGISVSVPQYAAYHSALNFKNPDDFIPERWLLEGEAEYSSDRKTVLNPFSYGPRNCLGKNLAYHEMRLVLASILWNFDMELAEGSDGWLDQQTFVLWKKGPLMVKLTPIRK
ncbi:cytochrome P450 [Zopfia rhizophila CBS 207.26]|uniref:Cytochrome P450 n=1 Tax=Zopfia rhizophila CBS 207.26 TaxID=1314779 RepID=A0A6A6EX82_9PEZI|nr:cytochrome P450 [Zopfia rhizophila CBS 207.26]